MGGVQDGAGLGVGVRGGREIGGQCAGVAVRVGDVQHADDVVRVLGGGGVLRGGAVAQEGRRTAVIVEGGGETGDRVSGCE